MRTYSVERKEGKERRKGRNAASGGGGGQVGANKLVALLLRLTTAAATTVQLQSTARHRSGHPKWQCEASANGAINAKLPDRHGNTAVEL